MIRTIQSVLLALFLSMPCFGEDFDEGIERFVRGFAEAYSESKYEFFYVSPLVKTEQGDLVYIYWMSGNILILADLPIGDEVDYRWYRDKAGIDLSTEVVPSPEDIKGSTYLTDSVWVEEKLRMCLADGYRIATRRDAGQTVLTTRHRRTAPGSSE